MDFDNNVDNGYDLAANLNYRDALKSETPPEIAVEQIRARKAGYVPDADREELANFHAENPAWREGAREAVAYQKRMANDFSFANFLKNDVSSATRLERGFYHLVGEAGRANSIGGAALNSVARAGYGLANTAPMIGNMSQLDRNAERIYALRGAMEAVNRDDKEYFATEADPSGLSRFTFFQNYGEQYLDYLLKEQSKIISDSVSNAQMSSLYESTEAMRRMGEAKTFGEAIDIFLSNPLQIAADVLPGMFVQMAPGLAAAALTGVVGGLPIAAMTQGLYSFGLDYNTTAMSFLEDHGVDTMNKDELAAIFSDPTSALYQAMRKDAMAHAAPVGALDAISMLAIVGRLGTHLPASVAKVAPSAARRYERFMASPYRRAAANILAQSQLQGALGAAGEGLGQLAQRGEIYSPSDVLLEWLGEFATAPFESVSATISARGELLKHNLRTATVRKVLKDEVIPAAQESSSLKLGPEVHKEVLEEATKDSPYNLLYCDPEGLTDEEKAALSKASPAFAAALAEAEATGSDIQISYADFVTQIAPTEQANAFANNAHVEGELSQAELDLIENNTIIDLNQKLLISSDASFVKSASVVAEKIDALFNDLPAPTQRNEEGTMSATEKKANAKLVLHHVLSIAKDMGISPEDAWEQFGLNGVLSEKAEQFRVDEQGRATLLKEEPVDKTPEKEAAVERIKEAFLRSSSEKADVNGVYVRDDIEAPIDIIYGNEKKGVMHLLKSRTDDKTLTIFTEEELFTDIARAIVYGEKKHIYTRKDPKNEKVSQNITLALGEIDCILIYDTERKAWVLTGWNISKERLEELKKLPKGERRSAYFNSAPTHQEPTTSRQKVGASDQQNESVDLTVKQDSEKVKWLGAYAPDVRKILLSAKSNRSTFLHETGHWFLNARVAAALRLKNVEDLNEAQTRFVTLTEEAVKWASGKTLEKFSAMSVDERRSAEEKFARTYEAYLYEGRAPSASLVSLFRRFSSWLMDVYKTITGIPGAELSEDVRVLFDGLFVASEEAKQTMVMRGIYNMVENIDESVTSDFSEIAKAVNAAYADIEEEVREKILARFMRDAVHLRELREKTVKKLTEEGEAFKKQYETEEIARLRESSPVERLISDLKSEERKVRIRMPEGVTRKRIGDFTVFSTDKEALEKGYVLLDAEDAAQAYGFSSFDEMRQALENHVPIEEQVAETVERRMLEEHGELSTPEKISRAADEAIYSDASVAALSNELNALEKASGSRISNRMIFGPIVERIVGNTRIKDLRERAAITNATKAANKAYEALTRKGAKDTVVAARFKREQVYHTMLAAAISKKRSRIAKRIKALRKHYFNGKVRDTFPTAYLEQIETLMHAYGLAPEPKGAARQSYADFVASEQAAGRVEPPALPDAPSGIDPNERTVRDTEEILDFLEVLAATGRSSVQIEVEGKKRELAEIDDEISSAITASAEKRGISVKENGRREGARVKIVDTLKRIVAEHWRGPQALEVIEGKRFGAFWKYLVKPFDEAGTREASLRSQKAKELDEALNPLQPLINSHKLKFRRHLDGSFSDAQMVAIALNMNSIENIQRLIEGSDRYPTRNGTEKWELEDIVAEVQETFTAEQLKALQATWDVVGSLWNDIVELEYATNHRKPVGVQGYKQTLIGVDGQAVELQGGYYPIKYDPSISVMSSAELNALNERGVSALALMVGESKKTGQGHVMERVQSAPKEHALELTLVPAFTGLKSIIHDLCWRQPLENAWKLLGQNTKTAHAIRKYFGNEQYQALDKWLKGIANDGATFDSVGDGVARILCSGLSVAALGFNLVTAAIQLTGMAQTISVLGPKWSGIGALEFLTNPMASRRFVYEHSTMMQQRVQTQFRELGEVHAALVANRSKALERIQTYAYSPIVIVQTMVDIPTWIGAYLRELSNGAAETEAAARADRVVVETQGSGRLQDLSVIENGNAWLKLATVFYTFFNSTLNLARIHARNEQGLKRFGALLMVLVLQPIAEQMLRGLLTRGNDDDDDDEWSTAAKYAKSVVSFNLGLGVGFREFAGGLEGFGYKGPTGFRKVGDTINAFNQLTKMLENGEVDEAGAKAVITAIGEWTGLPYVMVNRLLSGANAYYIDEETDDWMALLLGFKRK